MRSDNVFKYWRIEKENTGYSAGKDSWFSNA